MKTKLCFLSIIALLLIPTPVCELAVYQDVEDTSAYNEIAVPEIVYDGLTEEQLIEKINKSLNSTISNKGELIVTHSLELGVDPYLATAIILHETGCKWECSALVKQCNNVGGQKGGPSCGGGSYKRYDTLDEGIIGYLDNLYYNYVDKGLLTPTQMGPKYAASTTWASKIDQYIIEIKNK